jgi:dTDP-glucose 4,6-dehydratase
MPRILITGAAGFLGSHLCDRFIAEGYEVVGMDNLITGDLRNLEHLQSLPQFTFVHHDVSTHIHLNGPLDYILHFASPASPIDYLKIPIQTLKVGSLGTHNCLGLALAKKARILVASTSEVYGDPMVHPQTEAYWGNVNPIGPRGVYDEAKRFQEALTMAYHTYHGLETRRPHRFWRRQPNAFVLLRGRFGGRHLPPVAERLCPAREHWQPGRNHHFAVCGGDHQAHRNGSENRL